jgi:hypothetical protein
MKLSKILAEIKDHLAESKYPINYVYYRAIEKQPAIIIVLNDAVVDHDLFFDPIAENNGLATKGGDQ